MSSFTCWWCENDFSEGEKNLRDYPGAFNVTLCNECASELDSRSDSDWDQFYDNSGKDLNINNDDYPISYGTRPRICRICGENRCEADEDVCESCL